MKSININGIEAVSLADISRATGLTTESLRARLSRGTLDLEPIITIGTVHFYSAAAVRQKFALALIGEQ